MGSGRIIGSMCQSKRILPIHAKLFALWVLTQVLNQSSSGERGRTATKLTIWMKF